MIVIELLGIYFALGLASLWLTHFPQQRRADGGFDADGAFVADCIMMAGGWPIWVFFELMEQIGDGLFGDLGRPL